MRLILSRKGFDSATGRVPSPIFEDGTMVSLPIPDRRSAIRYDDIVVGGHNLGTVVEGLTKRRIKRSFGAHLDPDLIRSAIDRPADWRPTFGSAGAAQAVLRNNGVQAGDLFLFFGWFARAIRRDGEYRIVRGSRNLHVLIGWLKAGAVLSVGEKSVPKWTNYHPHVFAPDRSHNTLYLAAKRLDIGNHRLPGAGAFTQFAEQLVLTAPCSPRSMWALPSCFFPHDGKRPLGYHRQSDRWELRGDKAYLRTVARGQEFVLHAEGYPGVMSWAADLIRQHGASSNSSHVF